MNDTQYDYIRDALSVWAPSWPRRVNRTQEWTHDADSATERLLRAQDDENNSPFVSTYSFPRGHTKENAIPRVDTLFIDFDFENGDYQPGSGDRDAWRRDLSHLLVRARMVARLLDERGTAGWRAALSGHKGIHLFLDFEPLDTSVGEFTEFVAGLNDYATDLIDDIASETGLDDLHDYVDVTSSDMGRLCRVPNTLHTGATQSFSEDRYCVPITLRELAAITPDRYESLTQAPRTVPLESRNPNTDVTERIEQYIQTATPGTSRSGTRSEIDTDWSRVA